MIGWLRLVFVLCCVAVATVALAPLQLLAMKTGWCGENRIRSLWHKLNVWAMGFRIHTVGHPSEKRPLLIASNHISWTDIEIMASRHDISFIAKSELSGWPVIGWLSRLQRPVYIERDRKRKSGEQASEIARRLAAREAIVLFPEGTTADGNMILPFKSSLFGAAAMAIAEGAAERVYVQPVAIVYTRIHGVPLGRQHRPIVSWIGDAALVPSLKPLLREGAFDVELHFGEPVEFTARTDRKEASRLVQAQVDRMMQSALRAPRPSDGQNRLFFARERS